MLKRQKFTKVIFHYTKKPPPPKKKPGSSYTIYTSRLWEKTGKFLFHTVFNTISTLRQKYCTANRNNGFEMIRLDSTVHLNHYLSLTEHNPSSPTPDSKVKPLPLIICYSFMAFLSTKNIFQMLTEAWDVLTASTVGLITQA